MPAGTINYDHYTHSRILILTLIFCLIILIGNLVAGCKRSGSYETLKGDTLEAKLKDKDKKTANYPVSSKSCQECHQKLYDDWALSHHALANRPINPEQDDPAFNPARTVAYGTFVSEIKTTNEITEMTTVGPDGLKNTLNPEMVIGHEPLRQYLIPFPGGRLQPSELAWDPHNDEWFDVFGDENRHPNEWGHWSNRGMNWNSQCAFCHMTFYEKGYNISTDQYDSKWHEQGVTCLQCHGPMNNHAKSVTEPSYERQPIDDNKILDNCASCHSRRENLTGEFKTGEDFHDHFRLSLPTVEGLYYPDGQIRDEVYVYGSFKMSKMGQAGVSCLDCHDPHNAKLILPVENNLLCLRCHNAPGLKNATIILPETHSHHPVGSTGNQCVECHMPTTTYMQRDERRDHGFIIPDPLLTKELDIPNVCNRCHTDQTVDWAVKWTNQWYGEKMNRPQRERTRAVAKAYQNNPEAIGLLQVALEKEPNPAWKATLLILLSSGISDDGVKALVKQSLADESPLVRSAAVRALNAEGGNLTQIRAFLEDPVRLTRLDTAWALGKELDSKSPIYRELKNYLDYNSDQPAGANRQGQFAYARDQPDISESWFRKAIEWDPNSPGIYENLGLILNAQGKLEEALQQAHKLQPENPNYPFMIGLLYASLGEVKQTEQMLNKVIELDLNYARAWYNLRLIYAQKNRLDDAISTIEKAEKLEPNVPDHPFVKATLYFRQNRLDEALHSAEKSLKIDPNFTPAKEMLNTLSQQNH